MKQHCAAAFYRSGFLACIAIFCASAFGLSSAACGARSTLDGDESLGNGQGAASGASSGSMGAGGGGGQSIPPSKIISLSSESVIESEAHVATASNGFVAVSWISIPEMEPGAIGYAFSVNKGDSFVPPAFVKSPDGRTASDPVLAVDAQKNFYLTWLVFIGI